MTHSYGHIQKVTFATEYLQTKQQEKPPLSELQTTAALEDGHIGFTLAPIYTEPYDQKYGMKC